MFCSIHFTVTFAGPKNIVRHTEEFVKLRFVKSMFHCMKDPFRYIELYYHITIYLQCLRLQIVKKNRHW